MKNNEHHILNYKDFLVYRYADPEKAKKRSMTGDVARLALQVLRDPAFPSAHDEQTIFRYIDSTPAYAWCQKYNLPAERVWCEFMAWRFSLCHT